MADWIPVTERLPEPRHHKESGWNIPRSDDVLVWFASKWESETGVYDCYLEFNVDGSPYMWRGSGLSVSQWGDGDAMQIDINEVTHWMPLPKPPES